jgi:hypothetical protein
MDTKHFMDTKTGKNVKLCEKCGKGSKRRLRCHRCRRLICRDCAERDFDTWWCTSPAFPRASSPEDCIDAERKVKMAGQ